MCSPRAHQTSHDPAPERSTHFAGRLLCQGHVTHICMCRLCLYIGAEPRRLRGARWQPGHCAGRLLCQGHVTHICMCRMHACLQVLGRGSSDERAGNLATVLDGQFVKGMSLTSACAACMIFSRYWAAAILTSALAIWPLCWTATFVKGMSLTSACAACVYT
jgi:hypothetical protein